MTDMLFYNKPDKPNLKCQKCGHKGPDVQKGPSEPRLLCHWCWVDSRPRSDSRSD